MSTGRTLPNSTRQETYASDDLELNKKLLHKCDTQKIFENLKTQQPKVSAFTLNIFESKVRDYAWSGQTEALKNYFRENIPNIKKHFKSIFDVMTLLPYLNESTSFLIKELPQEWLKTLVGYHYPPYIAKCLNIFPTEHWNIFLDHTYGGSEWFKSHFKTIFLKEILENLNGCADETTKQCATLLDYIGQDFLRNFFIPPHQLTELLNMNLSESRSSAFLDALNGKDQWLDRTFNNPTKLNAVLKGTSKSAQNLNEVITAWRFFLKYLNPSWQTNIFSHSDEFEHLLNSLCKSNNHNLLKAETFIRMIYALGSPLSTEDTTPTLKKSYELIKLIDDALIHDILLNDKSFRKTLYCTNFYKKMPYFKLVLFAITKACHFELVKENPSFWSMFDYSPRERLWALDNLTKAILNNEQVDQKTVGIDKGQIGKINKLYMETFPDYKPPFRHMSLGKSQPFV